VEKAHLVYKKKIAGGIPVKMWLPNNGRKKRNGNLGVMQKLAHRWGRVKPCSLLKARKKGGNEKYPRRKTMGRILNIQSSIWSKKRVM